MTSNGFTLGQPTRLRRATFVPSPADVAARRLYVGVSAAAVVVSAATLGAVVPLFF